MRKLLLPIALLPLVVALTGCGGGGSQTSPFAGSWSGAWNSDQTPVSKYGGLMMTVGSDGRINGTVANDVQNITGSVKGTIGSTGIINLTIQYPTETDTATGTGGINTTVPPGDPPNLDGSLSIYHNGAQIDTLAFSLPKQG